MLPNELEKKNKSKTKQIYYHNHPPFLIPFMNDKAPIRKMALEQEVGYYSLNS